MASLTAPTPVAPEVPRRRRLLILGICCMSLLLVGLDNTIVNVALPSIGHSLHARVSGLQWTVDAYTLVLASLLMLSGSMADRFGRRRVFQLGLVLFTLGSGLCSLAPTLGWLIAFRALQAVGGSMLNPVAMSIIRNTFTDPRERAQAIGLWAGMVGVSIALGPVVGGLLVQTASWPAIFWINLPVGLTALALTILFVPESKAPHARRIDPPGQLLVILTLSTLTYAIIEGPDTGWGSPEIIGLFAVSIVSLIALVLVELRRREPLIDPRFFRSIPFAGATVIAITAFAAFGGFLFLNTLYLQEGRHLSPLDAGLYTLPIAAMTLVFGPLSGRLVAARGARPALVVGGLGVGLSALMLTDLSLGTTPALLVLAYLVFGIGFGMVNPPITNTAVAGMPPAQAGVAAAIASTSRQIGQTLGVAIIGAIAAPHLGTTDIATASHVGWWIIAACGAVMLVLAFVTTTRRAATTAERVAEQLGSDHNLALGAS